MKISKCWKSDILRVWTFYGNSYFYWFPIVHCRSKQSLCNPGVNLKYQLKGRLKVVVLSIYCFKGIRRSQYFCHHCHKYGKNIINSHLFFLWHIYNFSHGHRRRRAVSFRLSLTQWGRRRRGPLGKNQPEPVTGPWVYTETVYLFFFFQVRFW